MLDSQGNKTRGFLWVTKREADSPKAESHDDDGLVTLALASFISDRSDSISRRLFLVLLGIFPRWCSCPDYRCLNLSTFARILVLKTGSS